MDKSNKTKKKRIEPLTCSLRDAERYLRIENGTIWKEYVETAKIPVLDMKRKNAVRPKWRFRIRALEEFLENNEGFPEEYYDSKQS